MKCTDCLVALRMRFGKARLKDVLVLWGLLCLAILILAFRDAPPVQERRLFSDQAVHIIAAYSIWHDGDLEYELGDLERFRTIVPAEPGPRGIFIKASPDGKYYYAKPFLYSLLAAPFCGLFELHGFTVLNALCFFLIGSVAFFVLIPVLGVSYSMLVVIAFMVFSPFAVWIPVAHPDLLIAALLAIGGYGILRAGFSFRIRLLAAFVLGLAVYEKFNFVLIAPFLVLACHGMKKKELLLLCAMVVAGWMLPTLVNVIQDGQLLSYKGARFYVTGAPFPLEEGWEAPSAGFSGHVFNLPFLLGTALENMAILPGKFVDFILGRVTGMVFYFPVALALLVLAFVRAGLRSLFVLAGFFAYLAVYWLVFPANGYGGAGSYGSRYLMQALPVLLLAFLPVSRRVPVGGFAPAVPLRILLVTASCLALVFQYRAFPPNERLVKRSLTVLEGTSADFFPLEYPLLPTAAVMLPARFSERAPSGSVMLFRTGLPSHNGYVLELEKEIESACFVVYQEGLPAIVPPLAITASAPVLVRLGHGETILAETRLDAGVPGVFGLDGLRFADQYFDLFMKSEIRWRELKIDVERIDEDSRDGPGYVEIRFHREKDEFTAYGVPLSVRDLFSNGIAPRFAWSHPEDWGMWSSGKYAALELRPVAYVGDLEFSFDLTAYMPEQSPERRVRVLVNGRAKETWVFSEGREPPSTKVLIRASEIDPSGMVHIGFMIENPVSPRELGRGDDARKLGIGLRGLTVNKAIVLGKK